MSSLFFLVSFVVVNAAVIRLRRNRPDMRRPYTIPFYPAPPILAILLNLGLAGVLVTHLWTEDPLALALSAAWLVLGALAWAAKTRLGAAGQPDDADTEQPAEPDPDTTPD
jgi:amino acid transporter